MSTAPKLTYAKIGNKAKNKIQADSHHFYRDQGEQQQDLFSHLNQDNLNYINKELKTMKINVNRDQSSKQEVKKVEQEGITNLDKLYNKYKGEEKISEKEPDLEETDRISTQEKGMNLNFVDAGQDYLRELNENIHQIRTDQNNNGQYRQIITNEREENQAVSRSYSQDNKRLSSLEAYFGVGPSANLDQNPVISQFINGLDDYLSDLTQSKSLKAKQADEPPPIKQRQNLQKSNFTKVSSRQTSKEKKRPNQLQLELKESQIKLINLKKSNTSFAERKSKQMIIEAESFCQPSISEQQSLLVEQKRNTIQLGLQLQKIRKFLLFKDNIIKNLELNNQLLKEEVTHLKINHEIILKKQYPNMEKSSTYLPRDQPQMSQKPTKRVHNQSQQSALNNFANNNLYFLAKKGHNMINPTQNIHSSRGSSHRIRHDDPSAKPQQLFKQFSSSNGLKQNSRIRTPRMNSESLEKIQKQFELFLKDDDDRVSSKKGSNRLKDAYY